MKTLLSPIPFASWRKSCAAFSLVEVTLALGIVSFSMLAVVGLLPVGLKSIKNANEQAGAANVVGGIADALRKASSLDGTTFTATFAGKPIIYNLSGNGSTSATWNNLDFSGTPNEAEKRLSAVLEILEMPTATKPGRAVISVAWPAQAVPEWTSSDKTWGKAEGSLTSSILFLPKL
jgi:type II secretory pathway pseudopilin PulG